MQTFPLFFWMSYGYNKFIQGDIDRLSRLSLMVRYYVIYTFYYHIEILYISLNCFIIDGLDYNSLNPNINAPT